MDKTSKEHFLVSAARKKPSAPHELNKVGWQLLLADTTHSLHKTLHPHFPYTFDRLRVGTRGRIYKVVRVVHPLVAVVLVCQEWAVRQRVSFVCRNIRSKLVRHDQSPGLHVGSDHGGQGWLRTVGIRQAPEPPARHSVHTTKEPNARMLSAPVVLRLLLEGRLVNFYNGPDSTNLTKLHE